MSSNSNGTSSPCKSKIEDDVVGSKPIGCMCNLPKKKNQAKRVKFSKLKNKFNNKAIVPSIITFCFNHIEHITDL